MYTTETAVGPGQITDDTEHLKTKEQHGSTFVSCEPLYIKKSDDL